jgi:hypothetical protein
VEQEEGDVAEVAAECAEDVVLDARSALGVDLDRLLEHLLEVGAGLALSGVVLSNGALVISYDHESQVARVAHQVVSCVVHL